MCTQLFQIYQKRTPTFLAEMVALVASGLLVASRERGECGLEGRLRGFYLTVLMVAVVELALKLIVFAVMYCRTREIANTYNTIVLIAVAVSHLVLWTYSIILLGNDELAVCRLKDQFFLKSYVFGYGAMIVGGMGFFLILIVPAIWVTFRAIKNGREEKEEE